MSDRPIPHLKIPREAWVGGDAADRLTATLIINGTSHHIEAIRIAWDDGCQRAHNPELEASLDAMCAIAFDGPFETVRIDDTEYVINITPFQ